MIWTLSIYMALTWAGPGSVRIIDFPSEESCYRALSAMRINDSAIAEAKEKKSVVAFCSPKEKK